VIWRILGGNESEARVYSVESGQVMTISGYEGGAVTNPRFVLVYDTKFDNGDIITQGFDPETGLSAPIAAKPAENPIDIPEPDPVGEIRALIQNKSSQKEKDVVTVPTLDNSDTDLNLASSTTGSTNQLDLKSQVSQFDDESGDISTTTVANPEFELTEYDLVITKVSTSTISYLNKDYGVENVPDINASSTQ
jgi:hypothetical protein